MDQAYRMERKAFAVYMDEAPDSINVAKMSEEEYHAKVQRGYDDGMEGRTHRAKEVFERFLQTHKQKIYCRHIGRGNG